MNMIIHVSMWLLVSIYDRHHNPSCLGHILLKRRKKTYLWYSRKENNIDKVGILVDNILKENVENVKRVKDIIISIKLVLGV